jgi:UDP:flavonoid glycosyltransferase YjiC (YdhE family)
MANAEFAPLVEENQERQSLSGTHIWKLFGGNHGHRVRFGRLSEMLHRVLDQGKYDFLLLDHLLAAAYRPEAFDPARVVLFGTSLPDWNSQGRFHPDLPRLIFCPESLEVPKFRHRHRHTHYVEASLRPMDESNLLMEDLHDKPVILAAFGTQSIKHTNLTKTYSLIAALARGMPKHQFVLVSPNKSVTDSLAISPNLRIVEWIPQRQLLTRVSVFIMHGGLGSIKESIMAGVPMIVLPALNDQPFNAMRVRFHGLGGALFPEKQSVESLEGLVRDALAGRFKDSVARMQQHFLAMEHASISHMLIDNHFASVENNSTLDCVDARRAATRPPNG